MTLNFSKEQALIVAMIADLSRSPDKREVDAQFISKAIAYGHTWAIEWEYGGLFGEADTDADVSFVTDVLDMWRFIESHYEQLDDEGRQQVEVIAGPHSKYPKFVGFDGNNETNLLSITKFLVEEMGRFAEFKGRDFDSHMPKSARYRDMLAIFLPMRPALGDRTLSGEEIGSILRRE